MTEAEELELLELEAEAARASGGQPAIEESQDLSDYALKALEMTGRTLDYPGGMARVAYKGLQSIPRAAGLIEGEPFVNREDFVRALQGRAPTMEEFAIREGAEPGMAQTAVGMGADIALDPLTYVGLPGVQKLIKGAETALGKNIYKSGLKRLDIEGAKYGKKPVSNVLLNEGVTGSYEQIQKKMDNLAKGYTESRDAILKKATEKGSKVPMKDAMEPLQSRINEIKASKDPNLQGVADVMQKDLDQYLKLDAPADVYTGYPEKFVTPTQASGMKSSTYNQLPDSAYAKAKQTPIGSSLDKTKAFGLKEATEKAVEKTSGKMAAKELKELNDLLGRLLTSADVAEREAGKEIMKNMATSVDAPLAVFDWRAALAKKAADVAKMTGPRTKIGKSVMDRGLRQQPNLLEQNLLMSPWLTIQRQQEEY